MKIECPVCHEEIPASQLNEIREFDCPHCHYRIEMDDFETLSAGTDAGNRLFSRLLRRRAAALEPVYFAVAGAAEIPP